MSAPVRVGVVGGGRMGAGIGYAFLAAGASVTVIEASAEAAAAARRRVEVTVARAVERGTLSLSATGTLARLIVSTRTEDVAGAELVVEAVPEDAALKRRILAAVEREAPDAWLGTNTSSLSVDGLASALQRPQRVIGLHFFNPVPASDLVEIVVGPRTAPELAALATDWVASLGKTAITVTDSPGFASSRLGVAIALEAVRMLEEGVASAEDIDTAMTLGYRHPVGPLRTSDLVGLDVRLAVARHLQTELGPRFTPPRLLIDMVERGDLGRKSGRGFYDWAEEPTGR